MQDKTTLQQVVASALAEDIGDGDITASLIAEETTAVARVITREAGVLCGTEWVREVLQQVDPSLKVRFFKTDGERLAEGDGLFEVRGCARSILTAERTALNFLQTLSGTATRSRYYADLVEGTGVRLLDTRKTLPGLRLAQKYAVTCGGCFNHRIGLYDAFLIKENHIYASGGIAAAVAKAREIAPGKPIEVEVENIAECQEALDAGADRIMLDNFDIDTLKHAVAVVAGRAELEASGNVTKNTLRAIAETGVDFISIGALTKAVEPLDLSMRFVEERHA